MNAPQSSWNPPPTPEPQKAGIATTSLVLGILSLVCLGPLTGIPAIICGHIARKRIRNSGGTLTGEGLALAGLIMGYINLAFMILVFPMLMAIAIPNFVKARTTAQHNVCIANLKHIESAKEQWALEHKKVDRDTVSFDELVGAESYIKTQPVCPAGGEYTVGAIGEAPACTIVGHRLPQ